ncbi:MULTISPECIES: TetR/AcrR family transcriptional regulator [unclassified Mycobacterium]|uniref:TetR/AcrR family transcriptional regulator n=1 Tax=unclassified Mycobacterium TaxID=2642494 RepID=UPI0029C9899A|nr:MULTISPECIES: TetR/AcrR family transcriptional regulator [unclassified Mycobacterium]
MPENAAERTEPTPEPPDTEWQERTVERRLSSARARALAHSSRFLAAALELVQETGRVDFTVQNLVDRSKLSLRSFYQHFDGKDELLLALYENLTRQFIADIRHEVGEAKEPLGQLEAFCRGFLARASESRFAGGHVVTIYHLGLEIDRPADFDKFWQPQMRLLTQILTACIKARVVRHDLTAAQLTMLLNSTLQSLSQIGVVHTRIEGGELSEDEMWSWCLHAVSPYPPATELASRRTPTRRSVKAVKAVKAVKSTPPRAKAATSRKKSTG